MSFSESTVRASIVRIILSLYCLMDLSACSSAMGNSDFEIKPWPLQMTKLVTSAKTECPEEFIEVFSERLTQDFKSWEARCQGKSYYCGGPSSGDIICVPSPSTIKAQHYREDSPQLLSGETSLTREEVKGVLNSIESKISACSYRPISLYILINGDGSVIYVESEPPSSMETTLCLREAVSGLRFRITGQPSISVRTQKFWSSVPSQPAVNPPQTLGNNTQTHSGESNAFSSSESRPSKSYRKNKVHPSRSGYSSGARRRRPVCRRGCPCGNSCISCSKRCHR